MNDMIKICVEEGHHTPSHVSSGIIVSVQEQSEGHHLIKKGGFLPNFLYYPAEICKVMMGSLHQYDLFTIHMVEKFLHMIKQASVNREVDHNGAQFAQDLVPLVHGYHFMGGYNGIQTSLKQDSIWGGNNMVMLIVSMTHTKRTWNTDQVKLPASRYFGYINAIIWRA